MTYITFDNQYKALVQDTLLTGPTITGRGGLTYIQKFGQDFCVDLQQEFPATTLRKLPLKNLYREFMWDVRGESDVNKLGKAKHFWDFLANPDGYLPASYGSSWRSWPVAHNSSPSELLHRPFRKKTFDQLQWIWNELRTNCANRQLVLTTLNPAYRHAVMKCPPCHPSVIFSSDCYYLDALVTSRSNDFACGVPLDVVRYALLLTKMATDSGLEPRFLKFSSANNHVYIQNMDDILAMVAREPLENVAVPWINPEKTIFDLDPETDFRLDGYKSHPPIKFNVAV